MNLYLIGYRGSGKSAVAPRLAARLGWPAIDSDEQIGLLTGQTVAEIFAEQGEPAFREWEQSVIAGLARRTSQVIALGGGAVLAAENRQRLRETGKTVWLHAPVDVLWDRINADPASPGLRPSLSATGGIEEIRVILAERVSLYDECADFAVDTAERTPEQIADEIANWLRAVDKA